MKQLALIISALAVTGLAGCGADGEPTRPATPRATTNVSVGDSGVRVGTSLNTSIGGVNIGLGNFGLGKLF